MVHLHLVSRLRHVQPLIHSIIGFHDQHSDFTFIFSLMVRTQTHTLSQKFREVLDFNLIWLSHNSSEILLRYLNT